MAGHRPSIPDANRLFRPLDGGPCAGSRIHCSAWRHGERLGDNDHHHAGRASQLVVESQVFTRNDLQPQPRFVYALDGSETRNTVMMGRGFQPQSSHARWEGQSLTITTTHTFADPGRASRCTVDVTQKLSLESPTHLVVEVTRSGALGGRSSTTRTVYTKG